MDAALIHGLALVLNALVLLHFLVFMVIFVFEIVLSILMMGRVGILMIFGAVISLAGGVMYAIEIFYFMIYNILPFILLIS